MWVMVRGKWWMKIDDKDCTGGDGTKVRDSNQIPAGLEVSARSARGMKGRRQGRRGDPYRLNDERVLKLTINGS